MTKIFALGRDGIGPEILEHGLCVAKQLKPFRVATLAPLPFIVWPLIYPVLFGESGSLTIWLWILPGIVVYGLFDPIKAAVTAKRSASAEVLESASFERFLIQRRNQR